MDELRVLNSSPRQSQSAANRPEADAVANLGKKGELEKALGGQASSLNRQDAIENAYGVNQRQDSATEEPISKEETQEAVKKLNDYVQNVQRALKFDFDEEAGKSVITVLDSSTKEVIRQIPDEVAVELARNLNAEETVSLFSTKA